MSEETIGFRRLEIEGLDEKIIGSSGYGHLPPYARAKPEEVPELLAKYEQQHYTRLDGLPDYMKERDAKLPEGIIATTFYGQTDEAIRLCKMIGGEPHIALYERR